MSRRNSPGPWPDKNGKYPESDQWTQKQIKQFDGLIEGVSSPGQITRIESRFAMEKFVKEHGKEKCDAMWKALGYDTEGQS